MTEEKKAKAKSFFEIIKERVDFSLARFKKIDTVEEAPFVTKKGEIYYIIKNTVSSKYLRLCEKDYFIWEQLDGTKSISELVMAYFMKFKTLAFERIACLMEQLYNDEFLTCKPVYLFGRLKRFFEKKSLLYWMERFKELFFQKTFPINNIDRLLTLLYKNFVFIFFTRPAKIFYVIVSIAGAALFFGSIVPSDQYHILKSGGSYALGFFIYLVIAIFVILIHEGAHAFAVKSYGRTVPRGGFLFYFGAPCFFAETSDIWMENKKRRIAVSWAGPYSELIMAGVLSIILVLWPGCPVRDVFFKMAVFCYFGALLNLNPFLEFDGYFMLMDWLEIPLLRKKSIAFIKEDLWSKLLKREKFTSEQKVFAVFGVLSIIWTAIAIGLAVLFIKMRFFQIIAEFISGKSIAVKIFSFFFFIFIIVPLVFSLVCIVLLMLRKLWHLILRSGILAKPVWITGIFIPIGLIITIAPVSLKGCADPVYSFLWGMVLFAVLILIVRGVCAQIAASSLRFPFVIFLVFALSEGLSNIMTPYGAYICGRLSTVALFGASAFFFYQSFFVLQRRFVKALYGCCAYGVIIALLIMPSAGGADIEFLLRILPPVILFVIVLNNMKGPLFSAFAMYLVSSLLYAFKNNVPHGFSFGLLSVLFMTVGTYLYYIALKKIVIPDYEYEPASGSDEDRFKVSFGEMIKALIGSVSDFSGLYNAGRVRTKIKKLCDNEQIRFDVVQVRFEPGNEGEGLVKHSGSCVKMGEKLFVSVRESMCSSIFKAIIYRILDLLYWEDREVLNQYFTRQIKDEQGIPYEKREENEDPFVLFRSISIFSRLSDDELKELITHFRAERYSNNHDIIKQGEAGDKYYVIDAGTVDVIARDKVKGEKTLATLKRGDYFGEVALIRNVPRTATIRTTSAARVFSLSKHDFIRMIRSYAGLIDSFIAGMEYQKEKIDLMITIPLFAEFSTMQIGMIGKKLKERTAGKGEQIIKQGDIGDVFYIIKKGTVEVVVD
ncbi:cyclic nucleotide-binding domain-containing protein, partial [Candidatus Auribacterota bacterium]